MPKINLCYIFKLVVQHLKWWKTDLINKQKSTKCSEAEMNLKQNFENTQHYFISFIILEPELVYHSDSRLLSNRQIMCDKVYVCVWGGGAIVFRH